MKGVYTVSFLGRPDLYRFGLPFMALKGVGDSGKIIDK